MKPALFLLLVMASTTACKAMDYGTRSENFNRQTRKSERLAFVNLADDQGTPYSVHLNRDKNHRGYAVQAPLHRSGTVVPVNFTFSRTKEYEWFSGMQMSFNF